MTGLGSLLSLSLSLSLYSRLHDICTTTLDLGVCVVLIRPTDLVVMIIFPEVERGVYIALRRVLDIEGRWSRGRREERRRKGEESIGTRKEGEMMG